MVETKDKFWTELFMHVWRGAHVPDSNPTDLRAAVGMLMRSSLLDSQTLAMRLGVMPNTVKNIMVTGKAKPEVLKNLGKLSRQFDMPLLADWFDYQASRIFMYKGKKQADRWGM